MKSTNAPQGRDYASLGGGLTRGTLDPRQNTSLFIFGKLLPSSLAGFALLAASLLLFYTSEAIIVKEQLTQHQQQKSVDHQRIKS
jgi:hypothetical protein